MHNRVPPIGGPPSREKVMSKTIRNATLAVAVLLAAATPGLSSTAEARPFGMHGGFGHGGWGGGWGHGGWGHGGWGGGWGGVGVGLAAGALVGAALAGPGWGYGYGP